MRYKGRAPLRIDFGGGWTDVSAYSEEEGGAVLNAAITRYVTGYIARPDLGGFLHALRGDRSYVSYSLDLPAGAGLGASAAQTVLWLALVKTSTSNDADRRQIADMACQVATALGILGGKADEYASSLGGMHFLSFDSQVRAEKLELDRAVLAELRSRLVLVYTGTNRLSNTIHERVWSRYRERDVSVVAALRGLKRAAREMRSSLEGGDLDAFAHLLNENWSYQKELHKSVSNREVDAVFDLASRSGAQGGKACGAGGGGCAVFMARPGQSGALKSALRREKVRVFDFDFDTYGVFITKG